MTPELIRKYSQPVPRYTSYPTAPHFHGQIDHSVYAQWLGELPPDPRLSLYVHIPYCEAMCWFCGCHSRLTKRYDTVREYLEPLSAEIATVAGLVSPSHRVTAIHWGGGSPNMLEADDILRLAGSIRERFTLDDDCGFAVEIDARTLDAERVQAFLAAGVTRASFGVQDFDPAVQDAINRHQSFQQTRSAIEAFRSAGVGSINVDVLYGLPHQSRQSVDETIGKVISLAPDRIALFGYAHVPQKISRQKMIPTEALPDAVKRFGLANHMASSLTAAGYVRIGLDHFAKPTDELAQALARHDLRRNFQGYTVDDADVLLGLGASSIGRLPQGYIQNAVQTGEYARLIAEHGLAAVRGYAFTADDEMRAFAIERLMCDLAFPAAALQARYGEAAAELLAEAASLLEADTDGLVEKADDGFRVTERGRPFVRSICSVFDAHLGLSEARYSSGV